MSGDRPVWGLRVRYPPELMPDGMHQVDVTCQHGSTDPAAATHVDLLTAVRHPDVGQPGWQPGRQGWQVEVADSAYVVQWNKRDVEVNPESWRLAAISDGLGLGKVGSGATRRRFRFICPTCGDDVPARAEHLDPVVARLAEHGITSISLDQLRDAL